MSRTIRYSSHGRALTAWVLLATGGLAQADITIHSDPAVLESGQECLLTAHDPTHQDACYSWELPVPGSGTLLNTVGPDRIRYRAPRQPHPQNVIIRANITNGPVPKWVDTTFHIALPKVLILPSPRDPKGWAALDASPQAVWAAAARPVVVSLRSCELTAVHEDWDQRSFKWSTDAPQGGHFTLSAQGRGVVYHAPLILKRQTFRITATDPGGAKGSCLVDVLPPPMPKLLKDVLQPGNQEFRTRLARSMGEDWLLPHMTSFAELPAPLDPLMPGAGYVHCIQYVDDPEAGFPDRSWLVGRQDGIWKASRPDEVAHVALKGQISMFSVRADGPEQFPKTSCTAMAVRIPGSQAPAGRALVIGLEKRERDRQSYICALGPDGTVKPIVGSGDSKSASQFDYGSAKEVACHSVAGLALDRLGNIIWLDRQGNLRTISLDGKVAPFAAASRCHYEDRDKAERWRLLPRIDAHSSETYCGLALDPDSGELFVASSSRVYRIKPGGAATLVLGGVAPHPPVQDPYQVYHPCRLQNMRDLKLHHGCLYLVSESQLGILALNLKTNTLHPIVTQSSSLAVRRFGPLHLYAPEKPWHDCAALDRPTCLGIHDSMALVGLPGCLARLDLPGEYFAPVEDAGPLPPEVKESKQERKQAETAAPLG